ncbi:MAG: GTP-binding protein [Bryobacteraceae bacterium]
MTRPVIVPLGGFLGAGKTTLILAASRVLQARGMRCAAILNDQGAELVDTQFVQRNGVTADQVAGGCFCCRFSELIDAAERLRAYSPDVIFAEAVGSCTDLSATTLRPLKLEYAERFRLAPYSVLVDQRRAHEMDFSFLFQKQIDEADLICFTKADLYSETWGRSLTCPVESARTGRKPAPHCYLSPLTGQGVAEWLDEVLSGEMQPGGKILDIDYERYAKAEAALAWLNCRVIAKLKKPLSPSMVVGPLLEDLDRALTEEGFQIAHLKLMDDSPSGYLKASVTRNGEEPAVQGMLDASPAAVHELLLNIRAAGEPALLQRIVEKQLAAIPGKLDTRSLQCFSPAPPQPERR